MNKWLKRSGFALVILLLVAVVGGAIFVLNFDPKVYQDRLVKEIKLRYERDLKINGDLDLSLFPRIGLRVTDVTLSNKNSEEEFSSMEEVRFSVALWPLLFDRFLVDHVKVKGFKTHVVRYPDGSLNIDDFYALPLDFDAEHIAHRRQQAEADAAQEEQSRLTANEFKVDIAGLELEEGSVLVEDLISERQFSLENMSLHTGRITFGEPFSLALNAKIDTRYADDNASLNIRGMIRLDPAASIYQAERLNVALQGQIQGYKVEQGSLSGNFSLDNFTGYAKGTSLQFLLGLSALSEDSRLAKINSQMQAEEIGLNRVDTQVFAQNLALKGDIADLQERSIAWQLNSPNLNLSGFDAAGDPLTGTVQFRGEESMDLNVSLDGFSGLASKLNVRENKIQGQYLTAANRTIDIDFSSPLVMNLLSGEFSYTALSGKVSLSDGDIVQEAPVIASIKGDFKNGLIDFNADAVMDSERMSLSGSLEGLSKPQINFDLQAESLALDHILGVDTSLPLTSLMLDGSKSDVVKPSAEQKVAIDKELSTEDEELLAESEAVEALQVKSRNLSLKQELLSRLSGIGTFNIGTMTYRGLAFKDLGTTLIFNSSSDIKIKSLRAQLFGGELYANSDMSLDDGSVSLELKLSNVEMQELLKGLKARVLLRGNADIELDLISMGLSEKELLENLNGEIKFQAAEGRLQGFSVQKVLDDIDYLIGAGSLQLDFNEREQSPFTRFEFAAEVDEGVINFDSLNLEGESFSFVNKQPRSSYNTLNGDFDLNLQLSVRHPVNILKQGVRVVVKGFSLPLQIWNDNDSIQIKTEIQGIN
ncbi:MAG TPA: AsmA family protein [Oligella sp.]|nr:AsmA family protein [Oligella sp.]